MFERCLEYVAEGEKGEGKAKTFFRRPNTKSADQNVQNGAMGLRRPGL